MMFRFRLTSMLLASGVTRPPLLKFNTRMVFLRGTEILHEKTVHLNAYKQVSATNKSINRGLLSQFLPAPNDSWKLSKEIRPSFAREFRLPLTRFYFFADSPCGMRRDLLAGLTSVSANVRYYSTCKEPGDEKAKEPECAEGEQEQQVTKDCAPQPGPTEELCQEAERPCPPPTYPEDTGVCKPTPCPNIRDFCVTPVSHKETLWKVLCILSLPVVILMSGYAYTRQVTKNKQPRPEFIDVPYRRIVNKPFPWGGKRSFFHNPRINAVSPEGYDIEDPNALPKESD